MENTYQISKTMKKRIQTISFIIFYNDMLK